MFSRKQVSVSIVAHVDHGKSTLCDRIIEICENINVGSNNKAPILDSHIIEQTRGITIRNHFVRLKYNDTIINLIDTPGHYDFSKYVRIGIKASDCAVLVIDITKGIQAQTICYMQMCKQLNVPIIVAINKVDALDHHLIQDKLDDIINSLSLTEDKVVVISSKMALNINQLLEKIINYANQCMLSNENYCENNLSIIVMDVSIDYYEGTSLLVKIIDGEIFDHIKVDKYKLQLKSMYIKTFSQSKYVLRGARSGDLCYLLFSSLPIHIDTGMILDIKGARYLDSNTFSPVNVQIVPKDDNNATKLKDAIIHLKNNDPAVDFHQHNSHVYGRTFSCAFIGELHKEIFLEKLEIQCGKVFFTLKPDIKYMLVDNNISTPLYYPDQKQIIANYKKYLQKILVPMCFCSISTPCNYYDKVISLITNTSVSKVLEHSFHGDIVIIKACIPYEIILRDFNSILKGWTEGMADCLIEYIKYEKHKLSLIEVCINKEVISIFSQISLEHTAQQNADDIHCLISKTLKKQQYELCLAVRINRITHIKSVIKPYRKDVTSKCYGRDVSRKNKLLKNQKAGKTRLKETFSPSKIVKNIVNSLKS